MTKLFAMMNLHGKPVAQACVCEDHLIAGQIIPTPFGVEDRNFIQQPADPALSCIFCGAHNDLQFKATQVKAPEPEPHVQNAHLLPKTIELGYQQRAMIVTALQNERDSLRSIAKLLEAHGKDAHAKDLIDNSNQCDELIMRIIS